jgi:hypothetical protein
VVVAAPNAAPVSNKPLDDAAARTQGLEKQLDDAVEKRDQTLQNGGKPSGEETKKLNENYSLYMGAAGQELRTAADIARQNGGDVKAAVDARTEVILDRAKKTGAFNMDGLRQDMEGVRDGIKAEAPELQKAKMQQFNDAESGAKAIGDQQKVVDDLQGKADQARALADTVGPINIPREEAQQNAKTLQQQADAAQRTLDRMKLDLASKMTGYNRQIADSQVATAQDAYNAAMKGGKPDEIASTQRKLLDALDAQRLVAASDDVADARLKKFDADGGLAHAKTEWEQAGAGKPKMGEDGADAAFWAAPGTDEGKKVEYRDGRWQYKVEKDFWFDDYKDLPPETAALWDAQKAADDAKNALTGTEERYRTVYADTLGDGSGQSTGPLDSQPWLADEKKIGDDLQTANKNATDAATALADARAANKPASEIEALETKLGAARQAQTLAQDQANALKAVKDLDQARIDLAALERTQQTACVDPDALDAARQKVHDLESDARNKVSVANSGAQAAADVASQETQANDGLKKAQQDLADQKPVVDEARAKWEADPTNAALKKTLDDELVEQQRLQLQVDDYQSRLQLLSDERQVVAAQYEYDHFGFVQPKTVERQGGRGGSYKTTEYPDGYDKTQGLVPPDGFEKTGDLSALQKKDGQYIASDDLKVRQDGDTTIYTLKNGTEVHEQGGQYKVHLMQSHGRYSAVSKEGVDMHPVTERLWQAQAQVLDTRAQRAKVEGDLALFEQTHPAPLPDVPGAEAAAPQLPALTDDVGPRLGTVNQEIAKLSPPPTPLFVQPSTSQPPLFQTTTNTTVPPLLRPTSLTQWPTLTPTPAQATTSPDPKLELLKLEQTALQKTQVWQDANRELQLAETDARNGTRSVDLEALRTKANDARTAALDARSDWRETQGRKTNEDQQSKLATAKAEHQAWVDQHGYLAGTGAERHTPTWQALQTAERNADQSQRNLTAQTALPGATLEQQRYIDANLKPEDRNDPAKLYELFNNDPKVMAQALINDHYVKYGGQPTELQGRNHVSNTIASALGWQPTTTLDPSRPDLAAQVLRTQDLFGGLPEGQRDMLDAITDEVIDVGGENARVTVIPVVYATKEAGIVQTSLFKVEHQDEPGARYVDEQGWSYDSLDDYRANNGLPAEGVKLVMPEDGNFSVQTDGNVKLYAGDARTETGWETFRRETHFDTVVGVVGVAAGIVMLVGSGGTLAPLAAGVMYGSMAYGGFAATSELVNLSQHGQSLNPITNERARMAQISLLGLALGGGAIGAGARVGASATRGAAASHALWSPVSTWAGRAALATGVAGGADQARYLATNWDQMSGLERGEAILNLSMSGIDIMSPAIANRMRTRSMPAGVEQPAAGAVPTAATRLPGQGDPTVPVAAHTGDTTPTAPVAAPVNATPSAVTPPRTGSTAAPTVSPAVAPATSPRATPVAARADAPEVLRTLSDPAGRVDGSGRTDGTTSGRARANTQADPAAQANNPHERTRSPQASQRSRTAQAQPQERAALAPDDILVRGADWPQLQAQLRAASEQGDVYIYRYQHNARVEGAELAALDAARPPQGWGVQRQGVSRGRWLGQGDPDGAIVGSNLRDPHGGLGNKPLPADTYLVVSRKPPSEVHETGFAAPRHLGADRIAELPQLLAPPAPRTRPAEVPAAARPAAPADDMNTLLANGRQSARAQQDAERALQRQKGVTARLKNELQRAGSRHADLSVQTEKAQRLALEAEARAAAAGDSPDAVRLKEEAADLATAAHEARDALLNDGESLKKLVDSFAKAEVKEAELGLAHAKAQSKMLDDQLGISRKADERAAGEARSAKDRAEALRARADDASGPQAFQLRTRARVAERHADAVARSAEIIGQRTPTLEHAGALFARAERLQERGLEQLRQDTSDTVREFRTLLAADAGDTAATPRVLDREAASRAREDARARWKDASDARAAAREEYRFALDAHHQLAVPAEKAWKAHRAALEADPDRVVTEQERQALGQLAVQARLAERHLDMAQARRDHANEVHAAVNKQRDAAKAAERAVRKAHDDPSAENRQLAGKALVAYDEAGQQLTTLLEAGPKLRDGTTTDVKFSYDRSGHAAYPDLPQNFWPRDRIVDGRPDGTGANYKQSPEGTSLPKRLRNGIDRNVLRAMDHLPVRRNAYERLTGETLKPGDFQVDPLVFERAGIPGGLARVLADVHAHDRGYDHRAATPAERGSARERMQELGANWRSIERYFYAVKPLTSLQAHASETSRILHGSIPQMSDCGAAHYSGIDAGPLSMANGKRMDVEVAREYEGIWKGYLAAAARGDVAAAERYLQSAARADMSMTGVDPSKTDAALHARQMLLDHPGVFKFAGELTIKKEMVDVLLGKDAFDIEAQALADFLSLADESGMGVLIHCDWGRHALDASDSRPTATRMAYEYFDKLTELLAKYPNANIVLAHTGIGRMVRPDHAASTVEHNGRQVPEHVARVMQAMERAPNARFDISWNDVAEAYLSDPAMRRALADFISENPGKVMFGSDTVKPVNDAAYNQALTTYLPLFADIAAKNPQALYQLLRGNYDEVMAKSDASVANWTEQQLVALGRGDEVAPMRDMHTVLGERREQMSAQARTHFDQWLADLRGSAYDQWRQGAGQGETTAQRSESSQIQAKLVDPVTQIWVGHPHGAGTPRGHFDTVPRRVVAGTLATVGMGSAFAAGQGVLATPAHDATLHATGFEARAAMGLVRGAYGDAVRLGWERIFEEGRVTHKELDRFVNRIVANGRALGISNERLERVARLTEQFRVDYAYLANKPLDEASGWDQAQRFQVIMATVGQYQIGVDRALGMQASSINALDPRVLTGRLFRVGTGITYGVNVAYAVNAMAHGDLSAVDTLTTGAFGAGNALLMATNFAGLGSGFTKGNWEARTPFRWTQTLGMTGLGAGGALWTLGDAMKFYADPTGLNAAKTVLSSVFTYAAGRQAVGEWRKALHLPNTDAGYQSTSAYLLAAATAARVALMYFDHDKGEAPDANRGNWTPPQAPTPPLRFDPDAPDDLTQLPPALRQFVQLDPRAALREEA